MLRYFWPTLYRVYVFLPSVSPSFVHWTLPLLFATSHSTTTEPPSATSTSLGRLRKNCWGSLASHPRIRTEMEKEKETNETLCEIIPSFCNCSHLPLRMTFVSTVHKRCLPVVHLLHAADVVRTINNKTSGISLLTKRGAEANFLTELAPSVDAAA